MITVLTAFTKNYHYGHTFLERFFEFFPQEVNLIVYVEEHVQLRWGESRLMSTIPGYTEFMKRNDTDLGNGKKTTKAWTPKAEAESYSFRHDARKFAIQGFCPLYAAKGLDGHMIWLDADVFAYKPVTVEFLNKITALGDVVYLGRYRTHSEIGFVSYKVPEALPMLQRFYDMYNTDEIFNLREWHSAYVFDKALASTDIKCHNLTPKGGGHVWYQSPVCLYLDHCKGKRKDEGFSKERIKWDLEEMFKEWIN